MPDHKYILEHIEKRTYLKGHFSGKYRGTLDLNKSDKRYERFFNLEIIEGNILTQQHQIKKWPDETGFPEFSQASTFNTAPLCKLTVTLHYLDKTEKYFSIQLKELKLIDCQLSKQKQKGQEVYGCLEGYISGYILHKESVLTELSTAPEQTIPPENPNTSKQTETSGPIINQPTESGSGTMAQPTLIQKTYRIWKKTPEVLLIGFAGMLFALLWLTFKGLNFMTLLIFGISTTCFLFGIYKTSIRLISSSFSRFWAITGSVSVSIIIIILMAYFNTSNRKNTKDPIDKNIIYSAGNASSPIKNSDSLYHYLTKGNHFLKAENRIDAIHTFEKASLFTDQIGSSLIEKNLEPIYSEEANHLKNSKKYKEAISLYSHLISHYGAKNSFLKSRAACYLKTKETQKAVDDLKEAIKNGDEEAVQIHEKINPLRRRVAYYITRCCDGSTSNAKGRGACSHHGGVCDWNEPVYEEYRKYN